MFPLLLSSQLGTFMGVSKATKDEAWLFVYCLRWFTTNSLILIGSMSRNRNISKIFVCGIYHIFYIWRGVTSMLRVYSQKHDESSNLSPLLLLHSSLKHWLSQLILNKCKCRKCIFRGNSKRKKTKKQMGGESRLFCSAHRECYKMVDPQELLEHCNRKWTLT